MPSKIQVHDKRFRLLIKHLDIISAIDDMAAKINRDMKDVEEIPTLICTLNGALPFTAELMQRLEFDHVLKCVNVKSYNGLQTSGKVNMDMGAMSDIVGKRLLICEDLIDTGTTIHEMKKRLYELGAKDIKVCVLLFKPDSFSKRQKELALKGERMTAPDYYAMTIKDDFIVGFGMDYNELARNYKDIYILDE